VLHPTGTISKEIFMKYFFSIISAVAIGYPTQSMAFPRLAVLLCKIPSTQRIFEVSYADDDSSSKFAGNLTIQDEAHNKIDSPNEAILEIDFVRNEQGVRFVQNMIVDVGRIGKIKMFHATNQAEDQNPLALIQSDLLISGMKDVLDEKASCTELHAHPKNTGRN
jgi:hypothetical protein